ncbi:MAG: hypothetical protein SFX18_07445, partial [Pirellulales bacterium]|nr:hypothetical protein [Pirellulales bacterium]
MPRPEVRFKKVLFTMAVCGLAVNGQKFSFAGNAYQNPIGGWRYLYEGTFNGSINGFPAGWGSGNSFLGEALDGTWRHNQGDKWDGSGIGDTGPKPGGPAPGGVSQFTTGDLNYIRLQDTGNPEVHGWLQGSTRPQNSNRRINFAHKIEEDGPLASELVLDEGITITFRARIPNTGPLDPIYTVDANNQPVELPWGSVGGGGYAIHDEGRGMFYVAQNDLNNFNQDSAVAFSLATSSDLANYAALNPNLAGKSGGLLLNNLVGNVATPQIDTFDYNPAAGDVFNVVPISDEDLREWQEFWITIQDDLTDAGTHQIKVYLNGSTTPHVFSVTATSDGNAEYNNDAWLAMGLSSTNLFGAVDVDFYGYSLGVIAPVANITGPPEWIGASGANWTTAGSWSPAGAPNSATAEARFLGMGGSPVNLDASQTVNKLTFNTGVDYTLSGPAANVLSLAGTNPVISTAGAGDQNLSVS